MIKFHNRIGRLKHVFSLNYPCSKQKSHENLTVSGAMLNLTSVDWRFERLLSLVCILALITWAGCSRPTEVTGVAIESRNQPVFFGAAESATDLQSNRLIAPTTHPSGFDLSFLHNDHFGIFFANVAPLIEAGSQNKEFINSLEDWLVSMVGSANANPRSIERIWVILDRDTFDLTQIEQMPIVWVFDYASPIDVLVETSPEHESKNRTDEIPFETMLLSPTRLAFGQKSLLSKLESKSFPSAAMLERIDQLEIDADISGLVVIEPIQATLEQVFGILARFGDEAKLISQLPEQLKSFSFELSVQSQTTLKAKVEMKNERFAKESFSMINNLLSMANSFGSAAGLPLEGSETIEMPIELQVTEVIDEITNQISSESLFDIQVTDQFLKMSLQRPSSLDKLITAISQDYLAAKLLERRQTNLDQIAKAIAGFEEANGHLPPASLVGNSNQILRDSWRVSLLPFLGEQELYDQFDLNAAWNSPANLEVAKKIPEVFQVFNELDHLELLTTEVDGISVPLSRWHLVLGQNSIYRPDRLQPTLAEINDQKTRTAVVIEGGNATAVPWTAPQYLPIDPWMLEEFGDPIENGILMIDANFKARMVKRNSEYLQTLISSEPSSSLPRNAFFRR